MFGLILHYRFAADYIYEQPFALRYSGQLEFLPSMQTCMAFCSDLLNVTAPHLCGQEKEGEGKRG